MPRPKPPAPLKPRFVRMSDKQFMIFKQLGGSEWLREFLNKRAPFPAKYYEVFEKTNVTDHNRL